MKRNLRPEFRAEVLEEVPEVHKKWGILGLNEVFVNVTFEAMKRMCDGYFSKVDCGVLEFHFNSATGATTST